MSRTLFRVKRYAELRGNPENSRIKSRLGNINWYHELGTSKMEARPFAQPAAERVQQDLGGKARPFLDGGGGEEVLVRAVALAVEAEMKRIVTQKGIIDTGNLRASIGVEKVT